MIKQTFNTFPAWVLLVPLLLSACTTTMHRTAADEQRLAKLNVEIGIVYLRQQNYEIAQSRFKQALALDPDFPEAHNALGLLYQKLGENTEAEKHFRHSVSGQDAYTAGQNNYASFLCANGRLEEATEQFNLAASNAVYHNRDGINHNAGLCMLSQNLSKEAEKYFRQALKFNKTFAPSLIQMAQLTYDSQRHHSARAFLQRYREISRHTPNSLWLGYQIENELQDRDAAFKYAMQLKAKFPDSRETTWLLSRKNNHE